jgi:hypothetical protein
MKHIFLFLILIIACLNSYCQTEKDTIEIRKTHGRELFYMNGKKVKPWKRPSILETYPDSKIEFEKAMEHRNKASWLYFTGAVIGFASIASKNEAIKIPGYIISITALIFTIRHIHKETSHLHSAIHLYNKNKTGY